jgi:hypothetical protein
VAGTAAQTRAALEAASAAAGSLGASASGAASSLKEAASGVLDSVNQATSGAVDSALSVVKELSEGVNEATASVQVLF